jgi:hypothetical protein
MGHLTHPYHDRSAGRPAKKMLTTGGEQEL